MLRKIVKGLIWFLAFCALVAASAAAGQTIALPAGWFVFFAGAASMLGVAIRR